MLKRDIIKELVAWKDRKHHPLVIRGLRQIGKTYIVKDFGKEITLSPVIYIGAKYCAGKHCSRHIDCKIEGPLYGKEKYVDCKNQKGTDAKP